MLAPLIVAPFCEAGEASAMHLHMAGHVTPPRVGMIAHDYVPLAHEFRSSWKKNVAPTYLLSLLFFPQHETWMETN